VINVNKKWLLGMIIALAVAALLSPFASSSPDGLERVAEDIGFLDKATSYLSSPIPDYLFPGIEHEGLATSVAGILGTLLTFVVMYGLGKLVVAKNKGGQ
jgi:cobalt/nickel transport protein